MLSFIKRLFKPPVKQSDDALLRERKVVVSFAGAILTRECPGVEAVRLDWARLRAVVIETNDSGPIGTDFIYHLFSPDSEHSCRVPQGATGEQELISRLLKLPRFDSDAFFGALSSMENATFICWDKDWASGEGKSEMTEEQQEG